MGQKFKKPKNDVLEIALDQWKERVRPRLDNGISLYALFPRCFVAFNNITTVVTCPVCSLAILTVVSDRPTFSPSPKWLKTKVF